MIWAVIVAAGKGLRMGGNVRKQYLPLCGKPILAHTLLAFDNCPQIDRLVLVVPQDEFGTCRQVVLPKADLHKEPILVTGGQTRQESVYNGLQAIEGPGEVVLIHDGVRPLVQSALIQQCIEGARQWGACIPGVAVADTLKRVDTQANVFETISREGLWLVQTPQAFQLSLIREAHLRARHFNWTVTDDASLIERCGVQVRMIPGSANNLKITTPQDLILADFFLRSRATQD